MSDDRPSGHGPDDPGAPPNPAELVVAGALAAHVARIEPDPAAWARIEGRLDDREPGRFGRGDRFGPTRRPTLVAAVLVLFLVVAGSVIVRGGATDGGLEMATIPASGSELAIVALTDDGRLVELGLDGTERREIYAPAADGTYLAGPLAVSSVDDTIYLERRSLARVDCGGSASIRPAAGQIVAVPFAGGSPEVVVPVGGAPAVQPGSRRLAYVVPADGDACAESDDWAVGVTDLDTGATGRLAPTGIDLLAVQDESGDLDAAMEYDGLPAAMVSEVRWAGTGDALWLMAGYGAGLAHRAIMHLDLAVGPDVISAERMQLVVPGGPEPTDGVSTSDRLFGATAFAVDADRDGVEPGRERIVFARGTRSVEVIDATLTIDGGSAVGTGLDVVLAPDIIGAELMWASDIDVAPTGQVLLAVGGTVAGPSPVGGSGAVEPDVDSVMTTRSLVVLDGSQRRVLAEGITSAAWVWTRAVLPEEPSSTDVPAFEPGTSTSSTTGAPDNPVASVPGDPGALDASPSPDPVAGSDRPEDAVAIRDAFVAFFEGGDQSALEGSGVLEPALDEGARTVPNGGKGVTVTIDGVMFTGDTSAEVRFRLDQDGVFFTAATVGTAVYLDGRWKVSAATMCTLLSRVQISCPIPG